MGEDDELDHIKGIVKFPNMEVNSVNNQQGETDLDDNFCTWCASKPCLCDLLKLELKLSLLNDNSNPKMGENFIKEDTSIEQFKYMENCNTIKHLTTPNSTDPDISTQVKTKNTNRVKLPVTSHSILQDYNSQPPEVPKSQIIHIVKVNRENRDFRINYIKQTNTITDHSSEPPSHSSGVSAKINNSKSKLPETSKVIPKSSIYQPQEISKLQILQRMNPILGNEELRINLKNPIKIISVQEAFADGEEPNPEQPDCPLRRFSTIFVDFHQNS